MNSASGNSTNTNSGSTKDRDDAVLEHIGRYRVSIRPVLRDLFFSSSAAALGNVLTRLAKAKRIQALPLKGGFSAYQLTREECRRRNLPENRGIPLGTDALHEAIAVLWFCRMGKPERRRLEDANAEALLPSLRIEKPHCTEHSKDADRIYRVYVPDSTSGTDSIMKTVRRYTDEIQNHPTAYDWLTHGEYAIAILVETESRKKQIEDELSKRTFPPGSHIVVEIAPGPTTLKDMPNFAP